MRIRIRPSARALGSVLLISLCTAIIIGWTLASYLLMVETQSTSVARSQSWNNIMAVTEAGVEDALQFVNQYAGTPNLPFWTNTATANNWDCSGNVFHVRRYLTDDQSVYYDAWVTNIFDGTAYVPVVHAVGHLPMPTLYGTASAPKFLALAGALTMPTGGSTDANRDVARSVTIQTTRDPWYEGQNAKDQIQAKGNKLSSYGIDADGNKVAKGDLNTNGTITNAVDIQNADVMGHVKTGPGGTIGIKKNGSVGSVDWVLAHESGIEDGWGTDDMNVDFPDVKSPNVLYPNVTWWTSLPAGKTVDGVNYSSVFENDGYYHVSSIGGKKIYVGTNANVVIWVDGSSSFSGQSGITIAPEGAWLKLYLGGGFSVGGNAAINNLSSKAINFEVNGLPSCTDISLTGNGYLCGVIYAPQANLHFGGGGNDDYDFIGSSVAKTITANGQIDIIYPPDLAAQGLFRGYIPSNWKEE